MLVIDLDLPKCGWKEDRNDPTACRFSPSDQRWNRRAWPPDPLRAEALVMILQAHTVPGSGEPLIRRFSTGCQALSGARPVVPL